MTRNVAFLRGMNVGGHRIRNPELCSHFVALGFTNVSAFLASGNVIFDARDDSSVLAHRIEERLESSLAYSVPTFLRTENEVRAIAEYEPFPPEVLELSAGKVQVALLLDRPETPARRVVSKLATEEDRLAIRGRELFWLPRGNLLASELDWTAIQTALGPMTVRTQRTVARIAAKFLTG